jgi:hypothetical protein
MGIKYSELKDEMKIMVYIPVLNHFYNANVIETVDSNFTIAFTGPIKGHHDLIKRVESQEQLDKWFFICKRQKFTDKLFQAAEDKFKENGKEWFFGNNSFLMKNLALK